MIVGGSYAVFRRSLSGWKAVLATGLLATAIDAPMERAMTDVFHYWVWRSPGPIFGVPIQNSVGWLVVSSIAAICLVRTKSEQPDSRYAPQILTFFCAFIVASGALAFVDRAWLALGVIVVLLAINRRDS